MNCISSALLSAKRSLWELIRQKGKFMFFAATSSSWPSPRNDKNRLVSQKMKYYLSRNISKKNLSSVQMFLKVLT